jgi:hypothetical protein
MQLHLSKRSRYDKKKKLKEKKFFLGNPDNQPEIVDFEDVFMLVLIRADGFRFVLNGLNGFERIRVGANPC